MRKSELIEKLNKIQGDPHVLMDLDKEGYYYSGVYIVEECYSTYTDPGKTYVWDLETDYEDAGFDSEEEWEEFKSDPEHNVIVLWP